MVSDLGSLRIMLDKLEFSKACCEHGLPAIQTVEATRSLDGDRFVVKERHGAGSRGAAVDLSADQAVDHGRNLASPVYQPFIKGDEYSVDFYVARSGKLKGVVVRERNLVVGGESQITTTIRDEDLEALCAAFAQHFRLYGHNMMQVIRDADGKIHMVECNPRFGGASTAAIAVGLDSFYWLLRESMGEDIDPLPFDRASKEIVQVRYPADFVVQA
jgi:carbamoyl-phosphate synthase large subunit